MSYGIKIKPGEDGKPQVYEFYGDVPENMHVSVYGHEDPTQVNIGVTLLDDAGKTVVGGYGTAGK